MNKIDLENIDDLIYIVKFMREFFKELSKENEIIYASLIKDICEITIEEAKNANRL